jgi:hypothetical protein
MAKKTVGRKSKRLRRRDPDRGAPNRRAIDHIMLAAKKRAGAKHRAGPKPRISASIQQAIGSMVQTSSNVIEEQIRAGQAAAERLRLGIASSRQLNADVNMLVESLAAATRQLGTTWLQVVSIIVRAIGTQAPTAGGGSSGGGPASPTWSWPGLGAITQTGKSGNATTSSSITPADPAMIGVPPQIVVNSKRVTNVTLDLHPRSARFVPFVQQLIAANAKHSLSSVKFTVSPDSHCLILTVNVPTRQPAGNYSGPIIDSSTSQEGGTLSVTISR